MRSCSRTANLQALLKEDPESRQVLVRTLNALDKLKKEDTRGTRTANLIDPNNVEASESAQRFLLSDNDLHSIAFCLDSIYGGHAFVPIFATSGCEVNE